MVSLKTLRVAFKRGISTLTTGLSMRTGRPLSKPTLVYLQVTGKCNARCVMCSIWKRLENEKHVPFETLKKLIDDLHSWLGKTHIQLGTGEPFLHPDMMRVVEYGNSKGMLMGTVTNGLLINDKIAEGIIANNFFNLNLSLDGVRPETHAFTRGIPNAYEKVMEAIDRLLFYREKLNGTTRIVLKPIIFSGNLDQLVPLAQFVKSKGLNGINFQPIQLSTDACREMIAFDNLDDVRATFDELKALKREGYPILNTDRELDAFVQYFERPDERPALLDQKCPVGFTNLWVLDGGVVHFCTLIDAPVGHVDDFGGFRNLWHSKEAARVRKIISKCTRPCLAVCLIRRSLREQIGRFFTLMKKS